MKSQLTFMLVLGNAKMVAARNHNHSVFYGKAQLSPGGKKTNLNKLVSCLSSRV